MKTSFQSIKQSLHNLDANVIYLALLHSYTYPKPNFFISFNLK